MVKDPGAGAPNGKIRLLVGNRQQTAVLEMELKDMCVNIFGERMHRLLEFFWGKNSSPIFSELVRARASHPYIVLVGTIKPCNFYY